MSPNPPRMSTPRTEQRPGPLMLDLEGLEISPVERELLAHPLTGGVILFSRNYQNHAQVQELIAQIKSQRDLLVAVDQEGGRVQRFKGEFTRIPPMALFGELYDKDPAQALAKLQDVSALLAHEIKTCGVDFSFAPVADLNYGQSAVIGDRALHSTYDGVISLARAVIDGFSSAGCASVIKHFPGHGYVREDTHDAVATDNRDYGAIEQSDLKPFAGLCAQAQAMMTAHVIYSKVDSVPASLSRIWLTDILRGQLQYDGAIVSDDLSMSAVAQLAAPAELARQALDAGSDIILVCNNQDAAVQVLDNLNYARTDREKSRSEGRRIALLANQNANGVGADTLASAQEFLRTVA